MIFKTYDSDLAENMRSFIKFKQSLGLKYETDEYYLHKFDSYYLQESLKSKSLKDIIKKWIILKDSETPVTQRRRIATIREFGKFLTNLEYHEAYIIPNKVCQKQQRPVPHFFTSDEIFKFFCACDLLEQTKKNSLHHHVLPMLFRLLYCCGLRTCEARKVKLKNTNLNEGYLDILNSKGFNNRRIYLPQDLIILFKKYNTNINIILPGREYFFPITREQCHSKQSISYNFKKIWSQAGLKKENNEKIRAYDFRHHFIFANINRWVEKNIDVNSKLPYLMRYMGHSDLSSTLYYFHLVPEFFSILSTKGKNLEILLPEVTYDED